MTRWSFSDASRPQRHFKHTHAPVYRPTAFSRPRTAQAARPTPTTGSLRTLQPPGGSSAPTQHASSRCLRSQRKRISVLIRLSSHPKATHSLTAATGDPSGERAFFAASRVSRLHRRCPANAPPNHQGASCAPSPSRSRPSFLQLAEGRTSSAPRLALHRLHSEKPPPGSSPRRACTPTLLPRNAASPRPSLRARTSPRTPPPQPGTTWPSRGGGGGPSRWKYQRAAPPPSDSGSPSHG